HVTGVQTCALPIYRVRPGLQVAEVDVLDHVRAGEVQHLGAVLLAPEAGLDAELARMDLGAHRAVEQHDSPLQRLEEVGHADSGCARTQAAQGSAGRTPSSRHAAIVSSARFRV